MLLGGFEVLDLRVTSRSSIATCIHRDGLGAKCAKSFHKKMHRWWTFVFNTLLSDTVQKQWRLAEAQARTYIQGSYKTRLCEMHQQSTLCLLEEQLPNHLNGCCIVDNWNFAGEGLSCKIDWACHQLAGHLHLCKSWDLRYLIKTMSSVGRWSPSGKAGQLQDVWSD